MFRNFLTIAFRNLFKNKVYSIINVTGLALGMAAAALLVLNIQYGLSIDQFHAKEANLYQVYLKGIQNSKIACWNATASPLAPALTAYPEVRHVTRVATEYRTFRFGDKLIPGWGYIVDPAFLNMFSFPLIAGDPETALKYPTDIVITHKMAVRLFGSEDPMGKTVRNPNGNLLTVTGVLADLPPNTRFKLDFLLPFSLVHGPFYWQNQYLSTYVELAPGADLKAVNNKISDLIQRDGPAGDPGLSGESIFLYPLSKVYLEGRFVNGHPAGGNIDSLKMLGGLAAILLLIACINFMNLSTARSEKRGKEVGIRKVVGAGRRSLVLQFIGESILLAALAGGLALLLVQAAIPYFDTLTQTGVAVPWREPTFWAGALVFVLFTGLLAGSYPAFYLSSFRPIRVLKGILQNGRALVLPRKILVVTQFVFSIFLINFTVVYEKQVRHELDREVGFVRDNLVYHSLNPDLQRNFPALKNELIGSGLASAISLSDVAITQMGGMESGLKWDGMDPNANPGFALLMESGGLVQTNGLTLVEGRDIDLEKYPGDTLSCVINEASVKTLGFRHPLGQIIHDDNERWVIVGVIKDFLVGSPDQASLPVLIKGGRGVGAITIRLAGSGPFLSRARRVEAIIKKYNPNYLTDLRVSDDDYNARFRQARNAELLIGFFTSVAIFVSCMGLLGLATYMTENRTREIGIRKVLGSSVGGIVRLLSRDFVRLVLLAVVIASPVAWLAMQGFLRQFAYRTTVDGWMLLLSGGAALLLALGTISVRVLGAARTNPAKNLRDE